MSDNHKKVKEYISLAIDEKVVLSKNYLQTSFNKNLSQNLIIQQADQFIAFKKELDNIIREKVEEYGDKKALQRQDIKEDLIQLIYDSLSDQVKNGIEEVLKADQKDFQADQVNPNLILSEIFLQDGSKRQIPEDEGEGKDEGKEDLKIIQEESVLKLSKIRNNFWEDEVAKFNTQKLFVFFEFLRNYGFQMNFQEANKDMIQGALLLAIHSSDKRISNLVYEPFFKDFVSHFTNHFKDDYEAEIDTSVFFMNPHIVLICSYNAYFCEYMDSKELLEHLSQHFEDIRQENYSLFLKAFVNLLKLFPQSANKIITLKLVNKIAEKILKTEDLFIQTLFFMVMNEFANQDIFPKNYLSKENNAQILNSLLKIFESNEAIRIFSYKQRSNATSFKPFTPRDNFLVSELFKKTNQQMIENQCTMQEYDQYNQLAGFLLQLLSKSHKLIDDHPQSNLFITHVFSLTNMFFYQKDILAHGLYALMKLLNRGNISIYREELFETQFLNNIFSVFERAPLDEQTIPSIINLLKLFYMFLETQQLSEKICNLTELQKMIDYCYKISKAVANYYEDVKVIYLPRGVSELIKKLDSPDKRELTFLLNSVLAQNTLVLQKISHTHDLDRKVYFDMLKADKLSLKTVLGKDKEECIQILDVYLMIFSSNSKFDRVGNYMELLENFTDRTISEITEFYLTVVSSNKMADFDLITRTLDLLLLILFFWKTKDEKLSSSFSKQTFQKLLQTFSYFYKNCKFLVDLNQNYQIYQILETLNLFFHLSLHFDYKFFDTKSFVFLQNLKAEPAELEAKVQISENQVYDLCNFLNTLLDVKNKCVFLNILIMKQLDYFINYVALSEMNLKYTNSLFRKCLETNFTEIIHSIEPNQFLSVSPKMIRQGENLYCFVNFVYQNNLYLNRHVSTLFKKVLDQNFQFEEIQDIKDEEAELMNFAVKEQPMQDTKENIQFLFDMAQKNIKSKVLFSDIIALIKGHFENYPSDNHRQITLKLIQQTNIFNKLVKLYKKDKVNLGRILKNLFQISKHFDLLAEISVPERVVIALLKTSYTQEFQEVYVYLFDYIVQKGLYAQMKDQIDVFFRNTKKFLDEKLFFGEKEQYQQVLKSIYYSLKVLFHVQQMSDNLTDFDVNEYIIKYVFQLFTDNYKLELTPVNNLYLYFNKYFAHDVDAAETLKFERKILEILFVILNQQKEDNIILEDFYLISKLIQYCFYVVDVFPLDKYSSLYEKYLLVGLEKETDNAYITNFYDFYLVLNFRFKINFEKVSPFIEKTTLHEDVSKSFKDCLTKIGKNHNFTASGYNDFIRESLTIYYILINYPDKLSSKDFKGLLRTLNSIYQDKYESIHKIQKLEKLFIDIFQIILKLTNAVSLKTSQLFLDIFINKSDFFIGSVFDKYIYMGMYNSFFKKPSVIASWILNDLNLTLRPKDYKEQAQVYALHRVSQSAIDQVVQQIGVKSFGIDRENILFNFLENVRYFDREKPSKMQISHQTILVVFEKIDKQFQNFKELRSSVDFDLIAFRLYFLGIALDQNQKQQNREQVEKIFELSQSVLNNIKQNLPEILTSEENEVFKKESKERFIHNSIKYLYKHFNFLKNQSYHNEKQEVIQLYEDLIQEDISNPNCIYLNNRIIKRTIRLTQNVYDEVRVCKGSLITKILQLASHESVLTPLNQIHLEQVELANQKKEELLQIKKDIIERQKKGEIIPEEPEPAEPTPEQLAEEHRLKMQFHNDESLTEMLELILFLYTHVSKNRLLLTNIQKEKCFFEIKENSGATQVTDVLKCLYKKLEQEYLEGGMHFMDERDNVLEKSKNIYYVYKLVEKVRTNNKESQNLDIREAKFLDFCINAIETQLLANMDPDIFTDFDFISILLEVFFYEGVTMKNKDSIYEILNVYIDKIAKGQNINQASLEEFLKKTSLYCEGTRKEDQQQYLRIATLLIQKQDIDQKFLSFVMKDYMRTVFRERIQDNKHLVTNSLTFFKRFQQRATEETDYGHTLTYLITYIKEFHERMSLDQKISMSGILLHFKTKTKTLDDLKFKTVIKNLHITFQHQSYEEIKNCLDAFGELSKDEDFHLIFKNIGFEMFFKHALKKYGGKMELSKTIAQLFLTYTDQLCRKKHQLFDMFETIKSFIANIEYYFILEEKELVMIYYKCIIHSSRHKLNAEYLINNNIQQILLKCHYKNETEFQRIFTAICFNLSFIFQPNEINLKGFFNHEINSEIIRIFDISLATDHQEILGDVIDILSSLIQLEYWDLFNEQLIKQIKLTINFYYNNEMILMRFLNILKIISIQQAERTRQLLIYEFDYLYLYNLHFRNLQNNKVNCLIKQVIYNQLVVQKSKNIENNLIIFGIPENIIHTFSFQDDPDVILINLKLIEYSLKYEKCLFFVKNHFMTSLVKIVQQEEQNVNISGLDCTFMILYKMYVYYENIEYLLPSIFFEDFEKLQVYLQTFENDEPRLIVTIAIIENMLVCDNSLSEKVNEECKKQLKHLIKKEQQYHENEKITKMILHINDMISDKKKAEEDKFNMFDFKVTLSDEEKLRLYEGIQFELMLDDKVYKRVHIKLDFVKMEFELTNFKFNDSITGKDADKIRFRLKTIKSVDKWEKNELESFEGKFKMYFRKVMDKNMFINLKYWILTENDLKSRTLYFIFENQFQCQAWKSLFLMLKE